MSDRYKGAILSPTAPTVTLQSAGGIYTSSQQLQYQGQGVWPTAANNPLTNSLRFRASANGYLNRTPASAGNRRTFTYSGWLKRGVLDTTYNKYFFSATPSASVRDAFYFGTAQTISIFANDASDAWLITTQVFRDPSAWYHIIVAVDTTQATASNRIKLYVNGVQVTAFSTANYPTQNYNWAINNTVRHTISDDAANAPTSLYAFDGYMTEINFIDGQALTPSSFGTTDASGIWQPIPYTGTYGTNGFYLPFTDNSALTTSSNLGLGKDFSGNGNYWVTNNISITAGSTYDSMKDVPTNTNSNTANYCTLNPLDQDQAGLSVTLSNGNLTASGSSYGVSVYRCTFQVPQSGKWYWESVYTAITSTVIIGIRSYSTGSTDVQYRSNGQKVVGGTTSAYGASWTTNDVIGVAVDRDAGTVTFYKNNSSQGAITIPTNSAAFDIAFNTGSPYGSTTVNVNFGQRPFSYTPPSGFYPLNTYNLPTPTILAGNQYFDATLYTGTGSSQSITNSGSMQPDLVWGKSRSNAYNNSLIDSVRGVSRSLQSNLTNAEDFSAGAYVTAFNSNGFTVGTGTANNGSGATYVAWQWRASNAAGVSNTQGTITSTVSANTTAGFSIVTYTGSGAAGTVGHGLGVAPAMIITKNRTTAGNSWIVWQKALTGAYSSTTGYIYLDQTAAAGTTTNFYDGTAMTSTTFRWQGGNINVNSTSNNYVSYCFAEIAGYSKFGSYTGNGSSDGPFIYTGFRPRWVMIRSTGSLESWNIHDAVRLGYNLVGSRLLSDAANAEVTDSIGIDILSNGFKVRTTNSGWNTNGGTYIYAAFAENPFKIARAR